MPVESIRAFRSFVRLSLVINSDQFKIYPRQISEMESPKLILLARSFVLFAKASQAQLSRDLVFSFVGFVGSN